MPSWKLPASRCPRSARTAAACVPVRGSAAGTPAVLGRRRPAPGHGRERCTSPNLGQRQLRARSSHAEDHRAFRSGLAASAEARKIITRQCQAALPTRQRTDGAAGDSLDGEAGRPPAQPHRRSDYTHRTVWRRNMPWFRSPVRVRTPWPQELAKLIRPGCGAGCQDRPAGAAVAAHRGGTAAGRGAGFDGAASASRWTPRVSPPTDRSWTPSSPPGPRRSMSWQGDSSTSIPPCSWAMCCLKSWDCPHGKKTQTGLFHQCRCAGIPPGQAPHHRLHSGLPQAGKAQEHLCGRAHQGGRRGRTGTQHLQAD